MADRTPRTPSRARTRAKDWAPEFLAELDRTLIISTAAKVAGVGRRTVYDRREHDEEFRAAWDEIIARSVDVLEKAAYLRATTGTDRPVFQGGVQVGAVREYSDGLLMFLLKARKPDVYRENVRHELTGAGGAPVSVRLDLDAEGRKALGDVLRSRPAAPGA